MYLFLAEFEALGATFFLGDRWFTVGYNPAHQMHHSWDSGSEVAVEFVGGGAGPGPGGGDGGGSFDVRLSRGDSVLSFVYLNCFYDLV